MQNSAIFILKKQMFFLAFYLKTIISLLSASYLVSCKYSHRGVHFINIVF